MQKMLTATLALSAMIAAPHAYSTALASRVPHTSADIRLFSPQKTHEWCRGIDPTDPGKWVWVHGNCP